MVEDTLQDAVDKVSGAEVTLLALATSDYVQEDGARNALVMVAEVLADVGRLLGEAMG